MKDTGIVAPKILLPNVADMTAFACIACDQFTSQKEYWEELKNKVGEKPSMLDLMLPEIYLEDNLDCRIQKINQNISEYLKKGIFYQLEKGFILTVRSTPYKERRIGLIGAVDLEKYEYSKKSSALIRSTEGTIEERIPPRLKIRENAELEFPHVMVLFDDEKKEIIEKLYENRQSLKKLYDFELNMDGGHITGYFVSDYEKVLEQFSKLLEEDRLISKYGKVDNFAFAVGDGNHSLATAKAHWNNVKKGLTEAERENHPAKYALCEFVNIYDDGIYFEPIHRFVSGVDVKNFVSGLKTVDGGKIKIYDGSMAERLGENDIPTGITNVDLYVKEYLEKFGGKVDYVHGEKDLTELVSKTPNSVGILFDKLQKNDLFKYVSNKGAFPRKTFSMGEGKEKRYYLEGRKITK